MGYCQGLNGLVTFFILKKFSEEECFWILVYMIEELMPRDYYTNMLALRADIQLIYKLLAAREPQLLDHLNSLSIDLSLITVESFLTIYTNTLHPALVDVVMDHFLSHGPIVLLKSMVLIMGYLKDDLLKQDNFGRRPSSRRAARVFQEHLDAALRPPRRVQLRPRRLLRVELLDQRAARVLHRKREKRFLQVQEAQQVDGKNLLQEELANLLPGARELQTCD